MAKKKTGYTEPTDYFPPEIRKMFEEKNKAKTAKPKEAKPAAKKK